MRLSGAAGKPIWRAITDRYDSHIDGLAAIPMNVLLLIVNGICWQACTVP